MAITDVNDFSLVTQTSDDLFNRQVRLTWTHNSTYDGGYRVFYTLDGSQPTVSTLTYIDAPVPTVGSTCTATIKPVAYNQTLKAILVGKCTTVIANYDLTVDNSWATQFMVWQSGKGYYVNGSGAKFSKTMTTPSNCDWYITATFASSVGLFFVNDGSTIQLSPYGTITQGTNIYKLSVSSLVDNAIRGIGLTGGYQIGSNNYFSRIKIVNPNSITFSDPATTTVAYTMPNNSIITDFAFVTPTTTDLFNKQLRLTWTHNTNYDQGYTVYYTTDGSNPTTATPTKIDVTAPNSTATIPNVLYNQTVKAILIGKSTDYLYQNNWTASSSDGWTLTNLSNQVNYLNASYNGATTSEALRSFTLNNHIVKVDGTWSTQNASKAVTLNVAFGGTTYFNNSTSSTTKSDWTYTSSPLTGTGNLDIKFTTTVYNLDSASITITGVKIYSSTPSSSDSSNIQSMVMPSNNLITDFHYLSTDLANRKVTLAWTHNSNYDQGYRVYYTLDGSTPTTTSPLYKDVSAPSSGTSCTVDISPVYYMQNLQAILVGRKALEIYKSDFSIGADGWSLGSGFTYDSANKRIKGGIGSSTYFYKLFNISNSTCKLIVGFYTPLGILVQQTSTVLENSNISAGYYTKSYNLTINSSSSIQIGNTNSVSGMYFDNIRIVDSGNITTSDQTTNTVSYLMENNSLIQDFQVIYTDWVNDKLAIGWTHVSNYTSYSLHYTIDGSLPDTSDPSVEISSPLSGFNTVIFNSSNGIGKNIPAFKCVLYGISSEGQESDPILATAVLGSITVTINNQSRLDASYFFTYYYWTPTPNTTYYKIYDDLTNQYIDTVYNSQQNAGYVYYSVYSDTPKDFRLRFVPCNSNGESVETFTDIVSTHIGTLPQKIDFLPSPFDYKRIDLRFSTKLVSDYDNTNLSNYDNVKTLLEMML